MPKVNLYLRHKRKDKDGEYDQIVKHDVDEEFVDSYEIRPDYQGKLICNCPAAKPDCRHKKMLPIFDKADKGQDALYNRVTQNRKYIAYLTYNGVIFGWRRGHERMEEV